MKKTVFILFLLTIFVTELWGQSGLETIAEKSNFESTSTYNDVIQYIHQLEKTSKYIRTENIAISEEGKEIPLMILGNPLPKSLKDLKNDPRIVVYVQGNIHAGEVEGKEALLMFARDILSKKDNPLLKNVVLLICPIFNPDGNDKISINNRKNQKGPKNGVGVSYNGASLDLNRDALKMESPEMKGLMENVLNRWDPSVVMDCHTTNGVFRQEPVSFTWMVNPNGDKDLIHYMRDKMMPEMSKTLSEKYKVENCFYGKFDDMGQPKGYVFWGHEPRYLVNYVGIRNRLAILNENYVYADYKTRVEGCYFLIQSLMDYAQAKKDEIKSLIKAADNKVLNRWNNPSIIDSFSFDYRVVPTPNPITIKTYEVVKDTSHRNYKGYLPTEVKKTLTLPYLADYMPNKSFAIPYAYLITAPNKAVLSNLKAHGIKIERLSEDQTLAVEVFKIKDLKGSPRLIQGHYTNTIEGEYVKKSKLFDKGTYLVRTSQTLGNVIIYLLEPQSGDGFLYWNFFDKYLVSRLGSGFNPYPVYRINLKTEIKSEIENQD